MKAFARWSPLLLVLPAVALLGCERGTNSQLEKKLDRIEKKLASIEGLVKQGGGGGRGAGSTLR